MIIEAEPPETPDRFVGVFEMTREDNPRYYKLFDGGEELVEETHRLNDELLEFKVPLVRIRSARRKLKEIWKRISAFHERYADWEKDAVNFLLLPEFPNIRAPDPSLYVLHFTGVLRDQVNKVTEEVNVTKSSFMARDQQVATQETRIYAILALVLSVIGAFLAALAFLGVQPPA